MRKLKVESLFQYGSHSRYSGRWNKKTVSECQKLPGDEVPLNLASPDLEWTVFQLYRGWDSIDLYRFSMDGNPWEGHGGRWESIFHQWESRRMAWRSMGIDGILANRFSSMGIHGSSTRVDLRSKGRLASQITELKMWTSVSSNLVLASNLVSNCSSGTGTKLQVSRSGIIGAENNSSSELVRFSGTSETKVTWNYWIPFWCWYRSQKIGQANHCCVWRCRQRDGFATKHMCLS